MHGMFTDYLAECLPDMLIEARDDGASYRSHAMPGSVCLAISNEVAERGFTTLTPDTAKPVVEDMDILKVPLAGYESPLISYAGMQLAFMINMELKAWSNERWAPNEAAVHRYHPGKQALGAHRDFSSDELLIAVFTLRGSGGFELLESDHSVQKSWQCHGGGLCLMRAPGLTGGGNDDRPLHRALPPVEATREALIYRQINLMA